MTTENANLETGASHWPNHVSQLIDLAHDIESVIGAMERDIENLRIALARANGAAAAPQDAGRRRRYDQGVLDAWAEAQSYAAERIAQVKAEAGRLVADAEARAERQTKRADEWADWAMRKGKNPDSPCATVQDMDGLLDLPEAQIRSALMIVRRRLEKGDNADPFAFALRWVRENMGVR